MSTVQLLGKGRVADWQDDIEPGCDRNASTEMELRAVEVHAADAVQVGIFNEAAARGE
jgi:hypothetical protein